MDLNIRDHIRPVSDFRKESAKMLKQLKENREPIVLTQRGRSVAVIVDIATYERLDYEHYLRTSYRRGLKDIQEGRVVPHAQVMKEVREILNKRRTK